MAVEDRLLASYGRTLDLLEERRRLLAELRAMLAVATDRVDRETKPRSKRRTETCP